MSRANPKGLGLRLVRSEQVPAAENQHVGLPKGAAGCRNENSRRFGYSFPALTRSITVRVFQGFANDLPVFSSDQVRPAKQVKGSVLDCRDWKNTPRTRPGFQSLPLGLDLGEVESPEGLHGCGCSRRFLTPGNVDGVSEYGGTGHGASLWQIRQRTPLDLPIPPAQAVDSAVVPTSAPSADHDERIACRSTGSVRQGVCQLETRPPSAVTFLQHIDRLPPNFCSTFQARRVTHTTGHDERAITPSDERTAEAWRNRQIGQIRPLEEVLFSANFGANRD